MLGICFAIEYSIWHVLFFQKQRVAELLYEDIGDGEVNKLSNGKYDFEINFMYVRTFEEKKVLTTYQRSLFLAQIMAFVWPLLLGKTGFSSPT